MIQWNRLLKKKKWISTRVIARIGPWLTSKIHLISGNGWTLEIVVRRTGDKQANRSGMISKRVLVQILRFRGCRLTAHHPALISFCLLPRFPAVRDENPEQKHRKAVNPRVDYPGMIQCRSLTRGEEECRQGGHLIYG